MNPLHLGEREVCFGDHKKLFGNGDWICSLVEHLQSPKEEFLVGGVEGISNLLEMLLFAQAGCASSSDVGN